MKISVVTISFNQAEFLEETIRSVLGQRDADFEYIIIDPGSTDGSREIIEKYHDRFAAVVFERDSGPGDGLNKGFARASGDIFFYLNSDDTVAPDAFALALDEFARNPQLDVICGHAWITDAQGRHLRRVWSDPFYPPATAYGAAIQIQPSTYFRASLFRKVGGFNPENRSNWDGELFLDFCLAGARVKIVNAFLSNYRVHNRSITGTGGDRAAHRQWELRMFRKTMGREMTAWDAPFVYFWKIYRQFRNPRAFMERLLRGPVAQRKEHAR